MAEMVVAAWSYDTKSKRGTAHFCNTVPMVDPGWIGRYYGAICGMRLYEAIGLKRIVRAHDEPKCKRCVAIAARHREEIRRQREAAQSPATSEAAPEARNGD
jgi:hypothetical protein